MALKTRKNFLTVIKECHSEKLWTDVILQHRGSALTCHKFVLGTSSSVFQEVFHKSSTVDQDEPATLVFDGAFDFAEIEQLLSYVYGVSSALPMSMSCLFPSHLQCKPDIKPEVEEANNQSRNGKSGLLDIDYWSENRHNGYDNHDFDYEDVQEWDNLYDEDYKGPNSSKKKQKKANSENTDKPKSECPYCGKMINKLSKHVFTSHKDEWPDFNQNNKSPVIRKKEFPKQCPHCPKLLSCNWHFTRHLKTHTEPKIKKEKKEKEPEEIGSFVCTQCGEEFSTKKAMKSHEYKHKNEIACDFKDCNEIFLSHLAYSNHMLFKHQRVVKRRKCHARVKTGENDEEAKKKDAEAKKHLCTECGRGFREADSLKKHVIFVHTERAIPSCICNVCGKKFKTNNKLKNHMLLHEAPTLPCPFCDKLFETDHKVKKHIKSTHVEDDQKLYQCSYCQKGFSHFPSYESHMNSHKNIRPYQCHLCDNAYQNHFNLQQHVKKNHGIHISSNHNA